VVLCRKVPARAFRPTTCGLATAWPADYPATPQDPRFV
jgi:hypothetical protein